MISPTLLSRSGTQESKETPSNQTHRQRGFLSVTVKTSEVVKCKPLTLEKHVPSIQVTEDREKYRILVPMSGIDLRHVYVLAAPQSLLIEIRVRKTVQHQEDDPVDAEVEDRRVSRELKLRHPIERRRTVVDTVGDLLRITSVKASEAEENMWSDLVHFDTRASLGSV
jgi:HSP20 family molecular chaperone IbpA